MRRLWNAWIIAGSSALIGITATAAQAQSVYSLSAERAQGVTGHQSPSLKLWSGYGTNLSFLATDETIVQVWIDDPSRVVLDFDEPLCAATAPPDCVSGKPAVIHLRRIQGLAIVHLPRATGTLLTVITETVGGDRHLYEFRLEFATGEPDYHTVVIEPGALLNPVFGLMDVEHGLEVTQSRDLISPEQDLWQRLQIFLSLARNDIAIPTAANRAGVSLDVITQLAAWGAAARTQAGSEPSLR